MNMSEFLFISFFKRFIFLFLFLKILFYYKVRYTERRRDREEDLLSDDSLPKWPHWLGSFTNPKPGARILFQVSNVGAGSQGFRLSWTAFPGHEQGAGWEGNLPGLEMASIWDPRCAR